MPESIPHHYQTPDISKNTDNKPCSSSEPDLNSTIVEVDVLYYLYSDEKILVYQAIKFPDSESKFIHGHDIAENEAKFIIKKVVTPGLFDEDTHCIGGVIAWNITNTQPSVNSSKKRLVSDGVTSSSKRQKYIRSKTVAQTKTHSQVSKRK